MDYDTIPIEALPNVILPQNQIDCNEDDTLVYISHLISPESFYIQLKSEFNTIKEFNSNLKKHYKKYVELPLSVEDLPKCSVWAALSKNNHWLRAKVIKKMTSISNYGDNDTESRQPSDIHFEMLFVDFGFTEVVSLENIRVLEDTFCIYPPFAIHCRLAQVFPISKWEATPWSKEVTNMFRDLCGDSGTYIKAYFLHVDKCNKADVLLEKGEIVINEELVLSGLASSRTIECFQKDTSGEAYDNDLVNKKNLLKKEEQIDDDLANWDPMLKNYQEGRKWTNINDECAEHVFGAVDFEGDKLICNSFRYTGKCPREDTCKWKHIKPRTDNLPVGEVTTHFNLVDMELPHKGSWLYGIVSTAVSPSDFHIQILNSVLQGEDLEYIDRFERLQRKLKSAYRGSNLSNTSLAMVSEGELVVACCEDGPIPGVHRVRVICRMDDESKGLVKVHFLDVGIQGVVAEHQLKPLKEEFLRPCAQAIPSYLHGVSAANKNWSSKANTFMKNFVNNKTFVFIVAEEADLMEERLGLLVVDPENPDNSSKLKTLNSLFVQKGYACPVKN